MSDRPDDDPARYDPPPANSGVARPLAIAGGMRSVVIPQEELGQPVGFLTEQYVEDLTLQVALFKRLKLAVLKITDDLDWRDMGGNPYLQDSGIQKVAGMVALSFGAPEIEREDGKDEKREGRPTKFTRFICKLSATWRGRQAFDIGTSSTKDDFFAKANKVYLPYEDIDLESVQKKSVTNAQHRLLTKMLGLGGLSWEQLKESAGIQPRNRVRFQGGEQRRTTGAGGWTAKKEEIWGLLLEMAGGDEEAATNRLAGLTENKKEGWAGKRDAAQLSDKAVDWLLPRVRELYRKHMGPLDEEGGGASPREPGAEG